MLQTGIELNDQMSRPLQQIANRAEQLVSVMSSLQGQMGAQYSTASFDAVSRAAVSATNAVSSLGAAVEQGGAGTFSVDMPEVPDIAAPAVQTPAAPEVPAATMQAPGMPAVSIQPDTSGVQAAEQQVQTLQDSVRQLDSVDPSIDVNTASLDTAQQAIDDTAQKANDLTAALQQDAVINVDAQMPDVGPVSIPDATQNVDTVRGPPEQISIDTSAAEAQIQALTDQMQQLGDFTDYTVDVTPEVTQQPQIDIPDALTVPVTPEVTEQPVIDTPDQITVPVTADVTQQPEIDVPDELTVPVEAEVTGQDQIEGLRQQMDGLMQTQLGINQTADSLKVLPEDAAQNVQQTTASLTQLETDLSALESSGVEMPSMENVDISPLTAEDNAVQQINTDMQVLSSRQSEISTASGNVQVLPESAQGQIQDLDGKMSQLQASVQQISADKIDLNTEGASASLSALDQQMSEVYAAQEQLASAMQETPTVDLNTGMVDTSSIDAAVEAMDQAIAKAQEMSNAIQNGSAQATEAAQTEQAPTATWTSDTALPVFDTTGPVRYRQEVQALNDQLTQMTQRQQAVSNTAAGVKVLPANAQTDIANMQSRIQALQTKIQQVSNNKVNVGTDEANAGLEQMRGQLQTILQEQESLNTALENMDVSSANEAYQQLSQSVNQTETYIRDNTTAQGAFTQQVQQSASAHNELLDMIKQVGAAYLGINGVKNIIGDVQDLIGAENTQYEAESKLTTVMSQRMNASQANVQSILDLTSAQQQLGVIGDEVQLAGAQQLATFLNTDGALKTLIPAMNNLAAQQNGVNTTSENMVSIGNLMGKVMQGQTSALTRVGITFTDAQEKVLKYGTEEERAAMLAQVITDNVGNMNSVLAQTPEGKMQQVSNTIGDIKEQMGAALYPAVMNLFTVIQAHLPQLESIGTTLANGLSIAIEAVAEFADYASGVLNYFASAGQWVSDNWGTIAPIISAIAIAVGGLVAALTIYNAVQGIANFVQGIAAAHAAFAAGATLAQAAATTTATGAQVGMNAAILACPLTWIIVLIIAVVAAIFAVCQAIANLTGIANTGFGVITGGINVVIQFFKNLGLSVANIAQGIWGALQALCSNMVTAFSNAIANVKSFFYSLLSTAASVISNIAAALNELPFVSFDYSGITAAADNYAAKAAEAADSKQSYTSISDAFSNSLGDNQTFQEGWADDAFKSGSSWGDGVMDTISDKLDVFSGLTNNINATQANIPTAASMATGSGVADGIEDSGLGDSAASAAGSAADCAKSLDATSEQLKYLRDVAEMEAINRYTLATVNVDMSGMSNTVTNGMSMDDVVDGLTKAVNQSIDEITEGVHK